MNKVFYYLGLALLILWGCNQKTEKKSEGYTNRDIVLSGNKLTPEVLWELGRIGDVSVSEDRQNVLYTIAYTDIEANKSYRDVYVYNLKSKVISQITNSLNNESSVKWKPNSQKITYLSSELGSTQIWEMNDDGKNKKQLTDVDGDITNYLFSPNGQVLMYTKEVKVDKDIHDRYPDLKKANARIEDDIMYRHWNTWEDGLYSHIFIAQVEDGLIKDGHKEILKGQRFDSPLKPFGGVEQIAWSPDSKKIAYSCKKMVGKEYAESTNSDIYLYDLSTDQTSNLTEFNKGYDLNPSFSPNGKYMAWESMERDGYESDKNRLMILDLISGEMKDCTEDFDQNASSLTWGDNNEKVYFVSNYHGNNEIYSVNISTANVNKVTDGVHNFYAVYPLGDKLIATMGSMNHPTEIYEVSTDDGRCNEISFVNKKVLDQLKMGKVESRWITTTDNKKMQTWVIYPPDFDPNKKYPTLLYCQGGPQSTISQFWSLRWNFQLMAANGYIVVAPNRRGLPGFGSEWNEQISGDYGGQNMKDYFSAIDALAKEPYVDETKLGAIGASYGGFSIYWLAGHHNKRFKAFVSHCGIFNFEQMYATTEEMFFINWDMKGAYWDKDNKIAQRTYANSPHKFVQKWDTPILVIHGEKDFRIPYTQGMGAFNSAVMKGVPARFLFFPEECHWVLSPQNGILWHREFFRWLDTYLK